MSGEPYPLKDLVMVRKFRETGASRDVSHAQQALEKAHSAVLLAKEELEIYITWRVEEEERSYEKIINKEVGLAKLEELKQEIRALREKESDHRESILDAEKHVVVCDGALVAARSAHLEAQRDLQKLEEHREVWDAEQAVILAQKEEDEMDEFRVAPPVTIGE